MFSATSMRQYVRRAKNNDFTLWEKLQFKIEDFARKGWTSLVLYDDKYEQFVDKLIEYGFQVYFDKGFDRWVVNWEDSNNGNN